MTVSSSVFLSVSNILNVALSTSVLGLLAIGMTFVISSAGIDLSVGSILALSGVVGAMLTSSLGLPWWIGILGCLATGMLTGTVNGFLVSKAAIPPFIATLGMLGIAHGMAFVLSGDVPTFGLPPEILWIGEGRLFDLPVPLVIFLVTAFVAHMLLAHTRFVETTKVLVYTLSGFLAGLAGLVLAARIDSGQPSAGIGYEVTAITATILGGTSLFGGRGSIPGTLIGAAIMGVLQNGLALLAFSPLLSADRHRCDADLCCVARQRFLNRDMREPPNHQSYPQIDEWA
jgi:ribose/xylose/arabinose/galactoside ABC-type transport system permease subunit